MYGCGSLCGFWRGDVFVLGKYLWIKAAPTKSVIVTPGPMEADPLVYDVCYTNKAFKNDIDDRADTEEYLTLAGLIAEAAGKSPQAFSPGVPTLVAPTGEDPVQMAGRCQFPPGDSPQVTIIVLAHHDIISTLECLLSISTNTPHIPYEVIVVDDGHHKEFSDVLARVKNIRHIKSDAGFPVSFNVAARQARGPFLVFLSGGVRVASNWLKPLAETFSRHGNVGAAGPKVLYGDGRLQQAGMTVGADGSVAGIGDGDDPGKRRFGYPREVDCLPATGLMIEAKTFHVLPGFDGRFASDRWAGADLSLALRQTGKRLVYNPESVVVHDAGTAAQTRFSSGPGRQVLLERQQFLEKWPAEIDDLNRVRLVTFYYHRPEGPLPGSNALSMEEETRLCKKYGIYGWCFYCDRPGAGGAWSWPFDPSAPDRVPGLPFCLCWDDDTRPGEPPVHRRTAADIVRCLRHPDYIRINGRPLLLLAHTGPPAGMREVAAGWRSMCAAEGMDGIYLALLERAGRRGHPAGCGFDAAVEFPPHRLPSSFPAGGAAPGDKGSFFDYREWVLDHVRREVPDHVRFRTVVPAWNDASSPAVHSSPGAYRAWLEAAVATTREQYAGDERIVFIHAWNDPRTAAGLEPDRRHGHRYLEATRNALDTGLGMFKPL